MSHADQPQPPSDANTATYRAFSEPAAEPVLRTAPAAKGATLGAGVLLVTRGPIVGAQFLLTQPVTTAGRHPNSAVFLDDITVSRRHAEVRRESGAFRITDAGSLNGTYINRRPVDSAVLANHDEIQIGTFRLVFLTPPTTR